jgi:ATP-dependent DNA helicase DinG
VARPSEYLGPDGVFARALPGWETRAEQLAMADAVGLALAEQRPLLVEAGTGTGKTLAYLVPAALSGKRVVISTATRALQEQLAGKDLPLLRAHLPGVTTAVLKGVSNYVCRRRYTETADVDDPDLGAVSTWLGATVTGDRAELATLPDEAPVWRLVTTTPDARLGPRCPFFERCFVTEARRAASKADLVVVNHHLYFADLALRAQHPGAAILPEHDAVIFDEAHALEEVATEHFGVAVSTARLGALLRDVERDLPGAAVAAAQNPVAAAQNAVAAAQNAVAAAQNAVAAAQNAGEALFAALRRRLAALPGPLFGGRDDRRARAPDDLFADDRRDAWFRLDATLEELALRAARRAADTDDEALAGLARRVESLRADLATLAEARSGRHVHWAELRGAAVHLHASPVDVAPLMRAHVVEAVGAAIFTSATLRADGSFAFSRARLGLAADEAAELAVASPFDYARQALLYLPRDLPLPDDAGFAAAAAERTAALLELTGGRALCLYTSWRALRAAAAVLRARVRLPIRVQGEAPRGALLDALRVDVGSVLLATSSFWEGVDVPGEALSLVVVDKLPFQPPDDPLAAARAARVAEAGGDPFAALEVPRAALALKQGFGRLIRTRSDRGIVAVLDQRILTRSYGRAFIATLPPAARTSAFEQVRRFWEAGPARATCSP